LEKNPAVARVYSPADLLKKINEADAGEHSEYRLPPEREYIDLFIAGMDGMLAREWGRMCRDDGRRMRVSVLVKAMSSQVYRSLFTDIDRLRAEAPEGVDLHATGIIRLVIDAEKELIRTQMESFGLSALIICAMLAFLLRARRILIPAISVNLLPPLVAFAAMVAMGIKINSGTVLVASIAIGIAVDDTIHFCRRFLVLRPACGTRNAIVETLRISGAPIVATTWIIAAGFAVLMLAPFRPLMYFGGLTVLAVVVALVCDLALLPALLRAFWPDEDGKDPASSAQSRER
jgi:hypothetical protein